MLELETLVAFGIGAGLVALAPVVAAIAGKESKITQSVTQAGRNLTKQSLKVGLVVADKAGAAVRGIGNGFSEVGESFNDIFAEARADIAQAKKVKSAEISVVK
jgi:hypothetical protein